MGIFNDFYNFLSQKLIPLSLKVFCRLTESPNKQYLNFLWISAGLLTVICSQTLEQSIWLQWELNLWPSSYRSVSHRAAACLLLLNLNQLQMFLLMTPPGILRSGEANRQANSVCVHLHTFWALWLQPCNLIFLGLECADWSCRKQTRQTKRFSWYLES